MTRNSTILVVDDNEAVRDLLWDRLKGKGYGVETAVDGRDALGKMKQIDFDLVLLDIMMPEMNGYETLTCIKQDASLNHIPVVVLSALHDMNSVVKCVELGAEDYLFKPINSSLLWARITTSLEKKHLRDKEQARLNELAMLQKIDRELNASLDIAQVASITLIYAVQQTQADGGIFLTWQDQQWQIQAAAGLTKDASEILPLTALSVEELEGNGRVHQMPLNQREGFIDRANHRVQIPIHRDDVLQGLLVLESEQICSGFSCEFLSRLSDHVAIALNNARLYADVVAATRAKSNFVAMVSHELKTPLSAVVAYSDLMQKGMGGPLSEKQSQFLTTLRDGAMRMTTLVRELDDVTRIETGKLRLFPIEFFVQEVVDEVYPLLAQEFENRNQIVTIDIPANLPPLWADHQRLSQILINLLSNASKYTPEGGQITLSADMQENGGGETAVCFSVTDTGFGISQEEQANIFSQFFRSDDRKVRAERGAGLGLNITKKIVEMHGGRIWFESEYGRGTTFYFTMPVAAAEEKVASG